MNSSIDNAEHETRRGVLFAIAAFTIWGIAPIYFKAVAHVPAFEVLAHRVIWAFVLVFVLLIFTGKLRGLVDALKTPKLIFRLAIAALLVGFNWLLFIWAVAHDFILDASLGYYINPLLNVAIGMLFFSEQLRRLQVWAVSLAVIGVAIQIISFGSVPWIALTLAGSFSAYGAIRKKLPFDSLTGLWLEVLILLPLILLYFVFFAGATSHHMLQNTWQLNVLLIMAGVITTVPLLFFTGAAKRLRYSTLGFFQYIGPSLMFLLAVFVYGEAFTIDKVVTFIIIWSALGLYSFDAIKMRQESRRSPKIAN